MIVLASDYAGFKVLQHLVTKGEKVSIVGLDASDRGNFNSAMIELVKSLQTRFLKMSASQSIGSNVLDEIQSLGVEWGVLAWWPRIIKGRLLSIPRRGWINLHPSFLPYNRGKNPNFWCLADETPCGASLHLVDERIDSGAILARRHVETDWTDTGETVYHRCREAAIQLFKDKFDEIKTGEIRPLPQVASEGSLHYSKDMERASEIDLERNYSGRELLNLIRARTFPPHPSVFFEDKGKKYGVRITIHEINKSE